MPKPFHSMRQEASFALLHIGHLKSDWVCVLSNCTKGLLGSKEWRIGESAPLPPMWPGFKSRRRRHRWVEFVVGSLPCSETFFSGYSGFSLSSKSTFSNSNSTRNSGRRRTTLWMCYFQIIICLFIYFIITFGGTKL